MSEQTYGLFLTQKETIDVVRWAEHEERSATFASNVERAKAIKAKASQALGTGPQEPRLPA